MRTRPERPFIQQPIRQVSWRFDERETLSGK
jgi:hypothetical protein